MPNYDIALLLTVDAPNYNEAIYHARRLVDGIGQEGENISTIEHYEHDNDGQRVLYLPPAA